MSQNTEEMYTNIEMSEDEHTTSPAGIVIVMLSVDVEFVLLPISVYYI